MTSLGSNTATISVVNLQVHAEDQIAADKLVILNPETGLTLYQQNISANSRHYIWKSDYQTIPLGMDGKPEQFAERLADALPLGSTLRLPFNEFSFNPDGSLHDQYESFIATAVQQGFDIIWNYAGGDAQQLGDPNAPGYTALTNAELWAALQANIADVSDAWDKMLDWLDAHPDAAGATLGYELINEPASYRHSIHRNGDGDGYTTDDFVGLYADHMIALSDQIQARAEGRILVGAWGYSGDIGALEATLIDGVSAIDHVAQGVGDALMWSVHLYPEWANTDLAQTPAELEAIYDAHFAPLQGMDVLVTETNAHGRVNDLHGGVSTADLFTQTYEWFAENGVGLGWFPGAETGASNLVVIDGNARLRYLHQHSLAHALNAYSLGEVQQIASGDETIFATLTVGRLRNESYELDFDLSDKFDPEGFLGSAFGYDGDDTIHGTDTSNDMLYGGIGNDSLLGGLGDDFLYGQYGNDVLGATGGINHLFGGDGDDTLLGGSGYDQYTGGDGADTFRPGSEGNDVIVDFQAGVDRIDLEGAYTDALALLANMAVVDFDSDGQVDDITLTFANGNTLTLIDVAIGDLEASDFALDSWLGQIDGTASADVIDLGYSDPEGEGVADASGSGDLADGGGGDDWIAGYGGNDTLAGGDGADTLTGGAGDDVLTGGADADVFVFDFDSGTDRITDFETGTDRVDLSAVGDDFAELAVRFDGELISRLACFTSTPYGLGELRVDQSGDDVHVSLHMGGKHSTGPEFTIVLEDIDIAALTMDDFII